MRRLGIAVLIFVIGLMGYGITQTAEAAQPKVKICHRTGSETNPYRLITVPLAKADGHVTADPAQHKGNGGTKLWEEAGFWDGSTHAAGDPRIDYFASEGQTGICAQGTPPGGPTPIPFSVLPDPVLPNCFHPGSFTLPDTRGLNFDVEPDAPPFVPGETYKIIVSLEDEVNTTFPGGSTTPKEFTITIGEQLSGAACPSGNPPGGNPPGGNPPGGPGGPPGGPGSPTVVSPPAAAPPAAPAAPEAPSVPTEVNAGL